MPNFCAAAQINFFQNGHATFTDQSPLGMTESAVKTFIWITIAVYVLVAILKKKSEPGYEPLYNSRDFESDSFRKMPIL